MGPLPSLLEEASEGGRVWLLSAHLGHCQARVGWLHLGPLTAETSLLELGIPGSVGFLTRSPQGSGRDSSCLSG